MPARLRPTAPIAAEAVLVGDPGRALLLAQELLEAPRMSNHARGLWGYGGRRPQGGDLTVQSTGMGGPSAGLVLEDLAELGVRCVVRVGTCVAIAPEPEPGELLVALEAQLWGSGGGGEAVLPDMRLTGRLREALDAGGGRRVRPAILASLDVLHGRGAGAAGQSYLERADAADMQTATLLATAASLGVAAAAVLIVAESADGRAAEDEALEAAAKRAGGAASTALRRWSNPQVES